MDWTEIGLGARVQEWLESIATSRYTTERRLDPFATSMRDTDDVAPNLQAIRSGSAIGKNDAKQRVSDLKGAGLVDSTGEGLTPLGSATLAGWEKYGVATDSKDDELARLLILALEAYRLQNAIFAPFLEYWTDLRSHFPPLELIENWDKLFVLSYLDYERDGFAPGMAFRDEQTPVAEIDIDLESYVESLGASSSIRAAAERVTNAISGKVPRGRHRATLCMALEIILSGGTAAPAILERFGFPKKPRVWAPFTQSQKFKVMEIISDYAIIAPRNASDVIAVAARTKITAAQPPSREFKPTLPAMIEFGKVLVPVPKPASKRGSKSKYAAPRKVDYQRKTLKNELVGKLGEEFALAYERWRLRDHPKLLAQIAHVSPDDDSLGYDIRSFELDGAPRLVEVKGTLGPLETRFFLSANEIECANANRKSYVVLRVGKLIEGPQCCEIRPPLEDTLLLEAAVLSASFKQV